MARLGKHRKGLFPRDANQPRLRNQVGFSNRGFGAEDESRPGAWAPLKASLLILVLLLGSLFASAPALGIASESGADEQQSSAPAEFRDTDEQLAEVGRRIPTFGGSYFDDDDTLVIWLTEPNDRDARRLRVALDEIHDEGLAVATYAVREADYPFVDLKRWHDAIRMNIREVASDLVFTGFRQRVNRLAIGLEAPDQHRAAVEEELTRLEIPLEAVIIEQSEPIVFDSSLQDQHRPLVGGLQIQFPRDGIIFNCTHGFSANRSGITGFVTNSHCSAVQGEVDSTLYGQPNLDNFIGHEIADPPFFTGGPCPSGRRCRRSDANFVDRVSSVGARRQVARPALGSIAWNGTNIFRITEKLAGNPPINRRLQKVGRTTGRTRGRVDDNCVDTDVFQTDITMLCQVIVRARPGQGDPVPIALGGDSGSPWFRVTDSPQRFDVRLTGIHWGGDRDRLAVFSKMNQIENELGSLEVCFGMFNC
jgi:hypothetical protein